MGICKISGSLAVPELALTEMRVCADEMTAAETLTVTGLQVCDTVGHSVCLSVHSC